MKQLAVEPAFAPMLPDAQPRRPVLLLRWLVIIATSYMVLFSGKSQPGIETGVLLVAFIASNGLLHLAPQSWFSSGALLTALVLADSAVISIALLLSPGIEGDIFILYFFVILLAAVGGSFSGIVVAGFVIALLYVVALAGTQGWERVLQAEVLLRVPFIFCVCIFYGFLSEGARRERLRAETAELSERSKTLLISTLTHDVRNDLGTILGFAEILLDRFAGGPGDETSELLRRIQMTALQSSQLISNLLDVARIEAGRLRIAPSPLRLDQLLTRVALRYEAQATLKDVVLELDVPRDLPTVRGDDIHLDRVFSNLLSNAIKFSPKGGRVRLAAFGDGDDGAVAVDIADNGPGIPADERPRLFRVHEQTEPGARAGGTGLGLFVVQTVLEAHGARVDIRDADPRGAIFRVTFPPPSPGAV